MKEGDIVRIIDGSQAVRMDKYERASYIGLSKDNFKVIYVEPCSFLRWVEDQDKVIHDIHIENLSTGAIYLHSSPYVKKVEDVCSWVLKDSFYRRYHTSCDSSYRKSASYDIYNYCPFCGKRIIL